MFFTMPKLKARIKEIGAAVVMESQVLEGVQTCRADAALAPAPPPDAPCWRALRPGERWGEASGYESGGAPRDIGWRIPENNGSTHWLKARLAMPSEWAGESVSLALDWQAFGPQGLEANLYLDGRAWSGIDQFHTFAPIPPEACEGVHEVLLRCYVAFPAPFAGLRLERRNEVAWRLHVTMRALLEAVETYRESDPEGHALLELLNHAYNRLDLQEGYQSGRFTASAGAVQAELDAALADWQGAAESAVPAPRVLATGHSHLDVAWLWPLWRTRQKAAHTVSTMLNLMDRYPDFRYSMSQPQVFAFLKQDDPALYARLKQWVQEGRFEPVGAMWLEADCNLTSGESLVRQLVHGLRFWQQEFGEAPHVVWLPDAFGYTAALPQLMRKAGLSTFMTTKISWNQFNRMPNDTFRWRGIDGTEVLAHFVTTTDKPLRPPAEPISYTYNGHMIGGEVFGLWQHYRQKEINPELLYLFGWGDGGGGPTADMLETARVFKALPGFPRVEQGRVADYFERLYDRVWQDPRLPVWVGDLYLEYHRGTFSSQARTKQANRAAELALREAEWLNGWATLAGAPDRQARLNEAWERVLLGQFHDILPGSSIHQVYEENHASLQEAIARAHAVRDEALAELLGGSGSGDGIAVINSLPWERQEPARLPLPSDASEPSLMDAAGMPASTQLVEEVAGERVLLVEANAPAFGFTVLGAQPVDGAAPDQALGQALGQALDQAPVGASARVPVSAPTATRTSLGNGLLRLELDEHGEIVSLYDLEEEREVVPAGSRCNQLVVYEDRPLPPFDAWDIDAFYTEKPYPLKEILDWQVVEEGPLRAAVEIRRPFGHSTLRQRICLWRGSRRVDFITEVDWQERESLLKALFPVDVNAAQATCETQFGAIQRPTQQNTSWDWARFEVPAHRWVDMSEGGYGVALLNDGKYGHSLLHNCLGLTLLKGASFPDPDADRGWHRFTYSLLPHQGDWRTAQVVRRAYELNAPLIARSGGCPGHIRSLVSVSTDHVVLESVKTADDGNGLILRLYEAHNQRGKVTLRFAALVVAAVEADLLERELCAVAHSGNEVWFYIRPFEVKTLRLHLAR